jgi:hypothetical protein
MTFNLRSLSKTIAVAALGLAASIMPTTASAQLLDQALGLLSAGTAYGYNSCSYVNRGLQSAACQANRAVNVVSTLRQTQMNVDYRRRQQFDRRTQQLDALQRACKAGDEQSCARSGGADSNQMTVARALMDACTAGDRSSCGRAEALMDERNVSRGYAQQEQRYARPVQYAQNDRSYAPRDGGRTVCRAVIDQRTGYRIAGQLDCR